MSRFDDFRQIAADKVSSLADKGIVAARNVADIARTYARIAALAADMAAERELLRKAYSDIGRLYCALHEQEPDAELAPLVDKARASLERMDELQAEIDALKAPAVEVEIEEIPVEECCPGEKADECCCSEEKPEE